MDINQYQYMFEAEDKHWWYVGNHENFLSLLKRNNILKDQIYVLDAGCGTGKWLSILKNSNNINETGLDFQPKALEYARTRGDFNLKQGDVNECLFKGNSFDLITCFDVLCNRNIDDNKALSHFNAYLKENGHLLITLPAYNFLKSKHDQVVHTGKRYTRKQLRLLLENNGFSIVKISYVVSFLFPLAFAKRMTDKIFNMEKTNHNEVKVPSKVVNTFFLGIMRAENFILRFFSLPFGLSVMAWAMKKEKI